MATSPAVAASLHQLGFGVTVMLLTLLPFLVGALWQGHRVRAWRLYAADLLEELDALDPPATAPTAAARPLPAARLALVPPPCPFCGGLGCLHDQGCGRMDRRDARVHPPIPRQYRLGS